MVYFIEYNVTVVSFPVLSIAALLYITQEARLRRSTHPPPGLLDIYNMKKANIDLQTGGFYYQTGHIGQKRPKVKSFGCLQKTLTYLEFN